MIGSKRRKKREVPDKSLVLGQSDKDQVGSSWSLRGVERSKAGSGVQSQGQTVDSTTRKLLPTVVEW